MDCSCDIYTAPGIIVLSTWLIPMPPGNAGGLTPGRPGIPGIKGGVGGIVPGSPGRGIGRARVILPPAGIVGGGEGRFGGIGNGGLIGPSPGTGIAALRFINASEALPRFITAESIPSA